MLTSLQVSQRECIGTCFSAGRGVIPPCGLLRGGQKPGHLQPLSPCVPLGKRTSPGPSALLCSRKGLAVQSALPREARWGGREALCTGFQSVWIHLDLWSQNDSPQERKAERGGLQPLPALQATLGSHYQHWHQSQTDQQLRDGEQRTSTLSPVISSVSG